MTISPAQQESPATASPLDRLSTLLHSDMLKVNELILANMQAEVPLIPQLAGYLIAAGGKRVRPLLTLACTRLYGDNGERPYGLAASVEFIHTATLLHDDVVDGSDERRGKQAANLVFGNQASVLVGDFLFSRAFQLMVKDKSIEVLRILSDAAAIIAEGEVRQLTTANNLETSMADYIAVVSAKTAALFAAACEIGPVIAEQDAATQEAMRVYGMHLGIAFQIADDILDYNADQEKLGKTVGDDFREGKMTAPILFALEKADPEERAFWQRTIGDKDIGEGDLQRAQDILGKHNALATALELATEHGEKARQALLSVKDKQQSDEIATALNDLIDFTINRAY